MKQNKGVMFGVEKWPNGQYYEVVPADNTQGFERREISEEEYKRQIKAAKNMFK